MLVTGFLEVPTMRIVWWLTASLALAACAGSSPVSPAADPVLEDNEEVDGDDDDDDDEQDAPRDAKDAGKVATKDAGAPRDAKDASAPTAALKSMPCDVQEIVQAKCVSCHQGTGKFGAPMSLESAEAFQAENEEGRPYHEGAIARISGSEKPVMPPPPAQLSADEKKTLTDWLAKKAPASAEKCGGSSTPETPSETPTTVDECDVEMDFRAGFDKPFTVPTTPDYYQCFYFKPEFAEGVVGKGFLPLIDNDKVIHHWLLFVRDDASKKAGTSERCTGVNPGATLIAGWAPGGEPTIAPDDVGIQLPRGPNVVYQLELHYNNTVAPTETDHSGVKLCATKNKQKELAAIHYLGSENILIPPGMGTAQSTCKPTAPVTLLSVNPHMHKTGYHAKMVINRKNGTKEVYHDAPFSFESQVNYLKTAKVELGDTITTTCTFKNDTSSIKTFQEGTEDEMCYLFTLAYPIGAMNTGSDLLGIGLPGPNRCMR
jgi:cytochrome c551/c552